MNFPQMLNFIIYNAQLYDPNTGFMPYTAFATSGNKIIAIGSDNEILQFSKSTTEIINADKRVLLPAFTDSHTHFLGYVKRQQEIQLNKCTSLDQSLQLIRQKAHDTPRGGWITGGGWNHNLWKEGEYPSRHQLDEISTHHFIILDSKDWHTCWVNTPVLELAGIPTDKPYPSARNLAIDPNTGEFTGILEEDIRLVVWDLMPKWNYQHYRKNYLMTLQEFYSLGFSSIHTLETPDEFAIFQDAYRAGELGLRTFWYLPIKNVLAAKELSIQQGVGNDFLQIAGVKIFIDGAFGSQSAELLENYEGLGHCGVEVVDEKTLDEYINQAVNTRLSCAIHAIGDRAVRKTLNVLGKYVKISKQLGLHHRIEHAQLVHPDDPPRFKNYGITASVQPLHLAWDIPIIQKYLGNRAHLTYPLNSLNKRGVPIIFGSDTPIERFNPWEAIYTAMERRYNLDPAQPIFFPDQKLDLMTCLKAYTSNPASVVGMENKAGRILLGGLADFFIPDRNIFSLPPDEIKGTKSLLTVVDGKIVHRLLN